MGTKQIIFLKKSQQNICSYTDVDLHTGIKLYNIEIDNYKLLLIEDYLECIKLLHLKV